MIQKMKKLTFLVYHKEYDLFLHQLQQLGVLHIQAAENHDDAAAAETINQLTQQLQHVREVKGGFMTLLALAPDTDLKGKAEEAAAVIEKADELNEAANLTRQTLARAKKDVEALQPWGQFDMAQLKRLAESGIRMQAHVASKKVFDKQLMDYADQEISRDGKQVYFVTFTRDENEEQLPVQTVQLPEKSLNDAQAELEAATAKANEIGQEQMALAQKHLGDLAALEKELDNRLAFEQAKRDTTQAAEGKVKVLEGWFPQDVEKEVTDFLASSNTYYEVREPLSTDNVPIKFKNDGFSRMYERLTKMYGFPSYNEWDPTPIVAFFFTLFFAICMGDAGYGLVITLYGLLGLAGKTKNVPILGDMLSGCEGIIVSLGVATTIVGFFLGTFFGINIVEAGWIPQTTALGSLLAWLQGNVPGTTYTIQMAGAICIGVFHICLAMVIKALLYTKKEGFKAHIATWGWVILIVGGVITGVLALAGAVSEQALEIIVIAIGAVSALAIYVLNNVDRLVKKPIAGIIVNPLAGLYDTYNMASGLMGDVLSYIRLYALCLAGGMLGGAFNMIGDMVRGDSLSWTIVFAILIYVVGHLFNILMSAISAFVHPLRLNFVEYFKNAGYEGKGVGYKPLSNEK